MAFLETPRFPEGIAMGAVGGPMFQTVIASTSSRESRDGRWAYPRHAWDASHALKTQADFAVLRSFFMVARGRHHGWRFKDWADFSATHADGRVLALTATTFQLIKRYSAGAAAQDRLIKKPVATIEVKVSGVVTAHTLDTTTGIVTIASAPAAANVTWAGEFDVPMRFDTDKLDARNVARDPSGLMHAWDAIPIIEIP